MTDDSSNGGDGSVEIKFSHIQLYVDSLSSVIEYQKLGLSLNKFDEAFSHDTPIDTAKGRELWSSIQGMPSDGESARFVPHGRDVVKVSSLYSSICLHDVGISHYSHVQSIYDILVSSTYILITAYSN